MYMQIGGHVSIAGGFDKSIDRASAIGATILQTFASSPRSLKTTDFPNEIVDLYLEKKTNSNMGDHFFHGVYLVNLASESASYVSASIDSLVFYQKFAARIHGAGTIFHLGSHKGAGFQVVKKQVGLAIEKVLSQTPDGVTLFLENAAGQSGAIGADLSELRELYDGISSKELQLKLKVCYDTQHGFASGYDVRDESSVKETVGKIESQLGIDLIGAIHANDSMVEFDSHRDRHENIGQGQIGKEGFRAVVQHSKLRDLPFLLEVPGKDKAGPNEAELNTLKDLF